MGEYATGNPLAIPMAFRYAGRELVLDRFSMRSRLPRVTARPLLLLHGLCMNDLQWHRDGHDHGEALARDLGYTPVYLHYNSGLSVSTNGRILAQCMEHLYDAWPVPVQRLVMVGHSMGGLVARSAVQAAERSALAWPERLGDLVFLGTPHHGAPLERAGHWVDLVLGATPYAAPFARLGRVRSAGITDLRHGNVLDADWAGADRFAGIALEVFRGIAEFRSSIPKSAVVTASVSHRHIKVLSSSGTRDSEFEPQPCCVNREKRFDGGRKRIRRATLNNERSDQEFMHGFRRLTCDD